ncbi:uncharacterized protein LOC118348161 [Juglans regia]|uniref:Uncharacterized protein LOC118348161 n=1 Tax=Juglans regia TaxID=51240 RepID=A0A6P9ECI4_JUGRE|nr:uncharacterized protein LOC118348161 [Juglans regia]
MNVSHRGLKYVDGEICFQFSKEEIARSAEPFRFSIVLKFLKQRPSLDSIRSFINNRWGLSCMPTVSAMRRPRNVFIRMTNELDFLKALSREICDVYGIPYRAFHCKPDFNEDEEPSLVPVWIVLPGLPPNFYHESFLKIFTAPFGRYIRRDNPTRCATRTDGARLCLEMDATKEPITHFWIGLPGQGRKQEVVYETLPAFCSKCKLQGHNLSTCRLKNQKNGEKFWIRKDSKVMNNEKDGQEAKEREKDKEQAVKLVSENIEGFMCENLNIQAEKSGVNELIPDVDRVQEVQDGSNQDSKKTCGHEAGKEQNYHVEEVDADITQGSIENVEKDGKTGNIQDSERRGINEVEQSEKKILGEMDYQVEEVENDITMEATDFVNIDGEGVMNTGESFSEPELDLNVENYSKNKDYATENEGEERKKKGVRKNFEKVRSSTRVVARSNKS